MKRYVFLLIIVLMSISLFGCNTDTTTQADLGYSIEDFYHDMVVYEERIGAIISAKQAETTSSITASMSKRKMSMDEWTETISKEDILASHFAGTMDPVYDSYFERLSATEIFVTRIKTLLEEQKGIAFNEAFHPAGDETITFRFVHSEDGFALIDSLEGTEHRYLKIGLQENLLEYQEFSYYLEESLSPKEDVSLLFNFFKFTENKDAISINYSPDQSSLQCISIETDDQFTISFGIQTIEGTLFQEPGYVLNFYDRAMNTTSYLQVVDGLIVGEVYDVFDEYDLVFRYDDYDFYDDKKSLTVNFVTATGWDYVIASDASSAEIDQLTGIYLANGTKIYDDRFNYTFTPTSGFLGLRMNLNQEQEVSDELFSLNQYGMDLDHPKAAVAYLNQVSLSNFDQIRDRFYVENVDFFAEDLHEELYNYIDEDIRNDLEGKNDEPIVTTGDVETFNQALSAYESNLAASPQYLTNGTAVTKFLSEGKVISQSTSTNDISFDLESLYYRNRFAFFDGAEDRSYTYVLDGTKGNLVEVDIANDAAVEYHILSKTASQTNFLETFNKIVGDSDLSSVYDIKKISNTEFELTVAPRFLGKSGFDLNTLFEQQGVMGLEDQRIVITYEFTESFNGFTVSYTLSGLSAGTYQVQIISKYTTLIGQFRVVSPFDFPYYVFYLPNSVDQILFTTTQEYSRCPINPGTSYMRLYLEPGEYNIQVYVNYADLDVTVLDESFNPLPYDQRFTASYAGFYYVKFKYSEKADAEIWVRENPTPRLYTFAMGSSEGTLDMDMDLIPNSSAKVSVSSSPADRILILNLKLPDGLPSDYYVCGVFKTGDELTDIRIPISTSAFYPWTEPEYIFVPANSVPVIELQGYFAGIAQIEYRYLDVPTEAFENHFDWTDLSQSPLLFITEKSPIARVDFSVLESDEYTLETRYVNYGFSSDFMAALYRADGTLVTADWVWKRPLTAGDYYIEFTSRHGENQLVLVVPKILRP